MVFKAYLHGSLFGHGSMVCVVVHAVLYSVVQVEEDKGSGWQIFCFLSVVWGTLEDLELVNLCTPSGTEVLGTQC